MEKWQKDYVIKNLPKLSEEVSCNPQLLQILLSLSVLSTADYQQLISCEKNYGGLQQSQMLLGILGTRTGGYETLAYALYQSKQSGALTILLQGFQEHKVSSPFEKCNIVIDTKEVLSKEVYFQGAIIKLQEICSQMDYRDLERILKRRLNATTYESLFHGGPANLVKDTIPPPIPYYINRSLSIKKWLNPTVFTSMKKDIFIFQNMELSHLSKLARYCASLTGSKNASEPSFMADISRNQKAKLSSRFILLEQESHYQDIAQKAGVPVHWIRFRNEKYELYASNGNFKQIKKHLTDEEVTLTQEEFLSSLKYMKTVCISDSPGMGKSVLLAEIARKLKTQSPRNIVIFVRISDLLHRCRNQNHDKNPSHLMNTLISFVTDNHLAYDILSSLIFNYGRSIDLLFDGYDELLVDQFQTADHILSSLNEYFENVRIFVTTRHHMRDQLEATLSAYAFNIQPFQISDQIDCLVSYWKSNCGVLGALDATKFETLANTCLSKLGSEITDVQRNIAGIPLQCRLLADVYFEDAKMYAGSDCTLADYGMFVRIESIFDMYKIHINKCFQLEPDDTLRVQVKDIHMYLAMQLLFPDLVSEKNVPILTDVNLCKFGLLEMDGFNDMLRFVHRTFAEYLVAEFVVSCIKMKTILPIWIKKEVNVVTLLFRTSLNRVTHQESDPFDDIHTTKSIHSVITFFVDKHIKALDLGDDKTTSQFTVELQNSEYFAPYVFFEIISCTVLHDCYHLFSLLKNSYLTPDVCNDLKFYGAFPWYDVLLLSAKFTNLDFFRDIGRLVSSIPKSPNYRNQAPMLRFTSIPVTPLHVSVYRGHYFISDFLLGLTKVDNLLGKRLLLTCVANSYDNSLATALEKVQIIKSLLALNENLLEEKTYDTAPIEGNRVHIAILECLIAQGSTLFNPDFPTFPKVAHCAANYLQADELHRFCCAVISKNSGSIFKLQNSDGDTPIHIVLRNIDVMVETLKLLSEHAGIRFNLKNNDGLTEFAIAISRGRSRECVETILKAYGDDWKNDKCERVDDWENDKSTRLSILHSAIKHGNVEVADLFIELGIDVNELSGLVNYTPLHCAIKYAMPAKIIQKLLKKDSNINAVTSTGLTPLHYSVDNVENLRLLIEYGAQINLASYNRGLTPLHYAIYEAKTSDDPIPSIRLLIEKGANVNAKSNKGLTPLHLATFLNEENALDIAKLLIESGANINAGDGKYRTPLRYATENKCNSVEALLKSRGAKTNSKIIRISPVWRGAKNLLYRILESDSDVSDSDSEFSVDHWIKDELNIDIDSHKFSTWTKFKNWAEAKLENWVPSDSD